MAQNGSPELLIVMAAGATPEQTEHVVARLQEVGVDARVSRGRETTVIGAIGERELLATLPLEAYPGVEQVLPILKPYKLVSREIKPDPTVIEARGRKIGDGWFGLHRRPVHRRDPRADARDGACRRRGRRDDAARRRVQAAHVAVRVPGPRRRGALDSPRGAGGDRARRSSRSCSTRASSTRWPTVADVIQIGARNMQNFLLLSEIGRVDLPVLLKRGPAASVEELLMAAEYVAKEGNERIILCERGIRTFERSTRYTLDLGSVAVLKHETHLPVIVDPSHAAGRWDLVLPLARAAAAVGADGIIVEVHPRPEEALCDGPQQIPAAEFDAFARAVGEIVAVMGREIG